MTPIFRGAGFALLRAASLLVPRERRTEWRCEWRAELWHVRRACIADGEFSWRGEQEIAAFCMGAFEDALCLRREFRQSIVPLATTKGSARQCLLFLAATALGSFAVALVLPRVRAELQPPAYRLPAGLNLIQDSAGSSYATPTISAEQFRLWQHRRQQLFDSLGFYRIAPETAPSLQRLPLRLAHATPNLLEMLHIPVRFAVADGVTRAGLPGVILSEEMWRRDFLSDPNIAGRVVRMGTRDIVVDGVAAAGSWQLPGKVDAWLLEPAATMASDSVGFVVTHRAPSSPHEGCCGNWSMTAPKPDGTLDDFLCVPLSDDTRGPMIIFLTAIFLACLALPAMSPLSLGECLTSARKISWSTRLRRWSFLACKIALLLPIVYFSALDVAYVRPSLAGLSPEYLQVVFSFSICLFGLRWALSDQRQRCPVCLGKLTHPARVGQPSRNFLAWNGTELMCVGGHGLLHVPELATSWFSTQRWMYLDASWDVLFAEPCMVPPAYF